VSLQSRVGNADTRTRVDAFHRVWAIGPAGSLSDVKSDGARSDEGTRRQFLRSHPHGLEVRMMAIVAVERVGIDASDVGTKAKAMGVLQSYAARSRWEPEARNRAQDARMRFRQA
jgi:hypothetical protein